MRGDRLDAERAEHDRQDDRGRRVRVVDDDPESARLDPLDVERPQKVVRVGLRRPRGRRDLCHLVVRGAAELLPLEVLLDLLEELGRRLDPRRLEELDLHDLGIGGARTHVHARTEALALQEVAVDRGGHDVEVGDLDAGGRDPGDHRALQQPARGGAVAARHHPDAALEGRPERDSDAKRRLRRQVDVDEARDRVAAEEPRGEPRLPDQVAVDEGAGLDLLERVDADAWHDDALLADRAAVADGDALVQAGVRPDVAGLPDDGALDERAAAEVGRRVDDGARRARVLAQRDARREDGVRPDRRLRRDAAVVADERRALDGLEVGELHALPHPHVAAQLDPGDVEGDPLVEGVEVRLPELVEVADVLPVALRDVAVERSTHLEEEREELLREVERPALRHMAQHLGIEDVDAGVDRVREDLAPRRLLEEALDAPVLVGDDDPELERVVDALQADRDERLLLLVEADERAEVDVAERVPGDDEERLVERALGELHRAGRAHRRLLDGVADRDALALPRAEVAADRLRHEGERDDDVVEAVLLQELDDVLHARLADDRDHRLRLIRGERAQARAFAARHHDRLHLLTAFQTATP